VAELCDLLSVARSGYYARSKRSESARAQLNVTLCGRIQELLEKNRKRYGSPRITFGLRQEGYACNHKRVERLMRQQGLRAWGEGVTGLRLRTASIRIRLRPTCCWSGPLRCART